MDEPRISRRHLIGGAAAVPLAVALAACGGGDDDAGGPSAADATTTARTEPDGSLAATPACDDGDEATHEQTEGPYFKPDSPERSSLAESGVVGSHMVVAGVVLDTDCRPVRRALLDFWQADGAGEYDLEGLRLRGHQFTDGRGRFRLATVVPGLYPGRTRHIHVKVQAPGRRVLTTQIYFPGDPGNQRDFLYRPELEMKKAGAEEASFDFIVEA